MKIFKRMDPVTKILVAILIFVIVVGTIFLVYKFNSETEEIVEEATEESVEEIQVIDATADNLEFGYSLDSTTNQIQIEILNYNQDYNLYYYIEEQEIVETEQDEELNTEEDANEVADIANEDYILYNNDIITANITSTLYFKYEQEGIYSDNAYIVEISTLEGVIDNEQSETEEEDEGIEENTTGTNTSTTNSNVSQLRQSISTQQQSETSTSSLEGATNNEQTETEVGGGNTEDNTASNTEDNATGNTGDNTTEDTTGTNTPT